MNKTIARIGATVGVLAILTGAAFAQGKGKMKPKPVDCPVCHMPLSKTKTKADPVAVRLKKGGPVMYCCAGCKMPASVLVKTPMHHKKKK
jgi:hypothetical protein